ncbi:serine hydrolase [Bogoriella caseilytica]|uniref:Beta-lactamase class A n=1 Tax=Bogoriella caseilytica TaxID=56055 RepID=A0A3N2BDB1_9MICO|nr:serine hydrolase [Bogoriella caseilytica]ROR73215.1 beta-lactamase class A [Bogoriella caseilytica]
MSDPRTAGEKAAAGRDGTLTSGEGPAPFVAYRLATAEGAILAENHPDETFIPASTLKLAILVAVARALEGGALSLDHEVPVVSSWPSDFDGTPFDFSYDADEVDNAWPAEGTPISVGDILERMITVSSNEATNMAYDLVGKESVAAVFADAGCTHSALGRKYGDMLAAQHFGRVSYCTAGDLATLMGATVRGDLIGAQWTRYVTDLLSRQQDQVIGGVVPAGTPWGSKSGWVDGIRHDVAYIGEPGPRALVLGVCTRDFPDWPSAVAAIRALADIALRLAAR